MAGMAMDDIFDLDLALTMQDPNITSSVSGGTDQIIKSSESEELAITNNVNDIYMMMPAVHPAVGVCTVCMEGFESCTSGGSGGSGGRQILCGHVYHANCITKWLSLHNSCPLCRSSIVSGDRKTTLPTTSNSL